MEPPNNGHIGDEHFVHCSEVVTSSEVEMYGQYIGRGGEGANCVVHSFRVSIWQAGVYYMYHTCKDMYNLQVVIPVLLWHFVNSTVKKATSASM